MILFVASNPSRLNYDPNIAIIGSKSEKNFNNWVEYLIPTGDFHVVNISDKIMPHNISIKKSDYNLIKLVESVLNPSITKVIALGNNASIALDMIGVEYYKLPHPSPRNRFLNNIEQVNAVLEDCKKWLNRK